jgi:hypothetical protein
MPEKYQFQLRFVANWMIMNGCFDPGLDGRTDSIIYDGYSDE